jgi:hypothetical protein
MSRVLANVQRLLLCRVGKMHILRRIMHVDHGPTTWVGLYYALDPRMIPHKMRIYRARDMRGSHTGAARTSRV